jgi:hypothetical protein
MCVLEASKGHFPSDSGPRQARPALCSLTIMSFDQELVRNAVRGFSPALQGNPEAMSKLDRSSGDLGTRSAALSAFNVSIDSFLIRVPRFNEVFRPQSALLTCVAIVGRLDQVFGKLPDPGHLCNGSYSSPTIPASCIANLCTNKFPSVAYLREIVQFVCIVVQLILIAPSGHFRTGDSVHEVGLSINQRHDSCDELLGLAQLCRSFLVDPHIFETYFGVKVAFVRVCVQQG